MVSNIGTWMQRVAQDWIVLTQLTHHDATAVGIVTGLQFAPQLLLLPWSGLAADRFNQRKLLMLTQASMGYACGGAGNPDDLGLRAALACVCVCFRLWRRGRAGCASAANLCWGAGG